MSRHQCIFRSRSARQSAIVAASALLPCVAFAQTIEDCNDSPDPARQIAGCTAAIQQLKDNWNRSVAFVNRGTAFARKHAFRKALSDLDEAVKLDPESPLAYYNRGNHDTATPDFDRANCAVRVGLPEPWPEQ